MKKRIEFISFEEFQKLYKAEKDKEMKLCLLLGFGSGLRISEIVGLRQDLSKCCGKEVERKQVSEIGRKLKKRYCSACKKELTLKEIRRSNSIWKIPPLTSDKINLQTHQIRIDVAKGGGWRVTVTPPSLTPELLKFLPIKVPRRTLQYRFDQLTLKVLNKKMSFHILRHGFGNYQANISKLPLPIVQQMMGHSDISTTGIYTKANPESSIQMAWSAMTGEKI
jgi:integrase